MLWIDALLSAFSTYSAIPTPRYAWNERVGGLTLCFFPAVGLACGGALALWYALCRALNADGLLFSAVAACLPPVLTGGIHMDGFMDTVDAISSHRPREKKLEIMKDPHTGAFAVIYCGVYLLICLGLFHALWERGTVYAVCPGYILSRALSGLCAAFLPPAREGGMLRRYTRRMHRADAAAALGAAAVLSGVSLPLLAFWPGLGALALALLTVPLYRAVALRLFGGVTGDTAGFFLQLCEGAVLLGAWMGGNL